MYVSVFERVYKEEALVEVARNMLDKGFSAKDILERTYMSREDLAALMGGEAPVF
jgi:hypothetical protein